MTKNEKCKWLKGYYIARILNLEEIDRGMLPCGYDTVWGLKSALGLYKSMSRIVRKELIVEAAATHIDENGVLV